MFVIAGHITSPARYFAPVNTTPVNKTPAYIAKQFSVEESASNLLLLVRITLVLSEPF